MGHRDWLGLRLRPTTYLDPHTAVPMRSRTDTNAYERMKAAGLHPYLRCHPRMCDMMYDMCDMMYDIRAFKSMSMHSFETQNDVPTPLLLPDVPCFHHWSDEPLYLPDPDACGG